jgi:hypothetical protein
MLFFTNRRAKLHDFGIAGKPRAIGRAAPI